MLFFNILSMNSGMIGRLSYYFLPFNMILIPKVISSIKDKPLKIVGVFFLFGSANYSIFTATPGGTLKIDNYLFFLGPFLISV